MCIRMHIHSYMHVYAARQNVNNNDKTYLKVPPTTGVQHSSVVTYNSSVHLHQRFTMDRVGLACVQGNGYDSEFLLSSGPPT